MKYQTIMHRMMHTQILSLDSRCLCALCFCILRFFAKHADQQWIHQKGKTKKQQKQQQQQQQQQQKQKQRTTKNKEQQRTKNNKQQLQKKLLTIQPQLTNWKQETQIHVRCAKLSLINPRSKSQSPVVEDPAVLAYVPAAQDSQAVAPNTPPGKQCANANGKKQHQPKKI